MGFSFANYKPTKRQVEEVDDTLHLFLGNRWIPRGRTTGRIYRYRDFLKRIRDKEGPAAAIQYARRLAVREPFYLAHQLLGFKDLYEYLHGDLMDFIVKADEENWKTLIELPRSHYKSSIATTVRSVRWILMDQDVTIGLGSATLKDCKAFGRDIRGRLERSDELKLLFPDIFWPNAKKAEEKWTEEEFTVRRTGFQREATVTLFGLEDDMPTGKHFKKLLLDDVVNRENVRTPERIEKINLNANLLPPLLVTPEMPIHFVGTPYHLHDYYAKLEADAGYKCYIRPAFEHNSPIFPTKFSKAILEELRNRNGNYLFDSQYMMKRQSDADKKFKREWLKWDETPILPGTPGYNFFLCVDPANARLKDSDFTSMSVFAVDWEWNLHLVDGLHDKMNPFERITAAMAFARKWKITYCSWEAIGFQQTDCFWLNRMMREKAYFFPVFEVSHHKENKDTRIMGIQPVMQAGRFFVPRAGIPYRRVWVNPDDTLGQDVDVLQMGLTEMDFYPMSTHDDILDTWADARKIVTAGIIPLPEKPKDEFRGAYRSSAKREDEYNPMAH